MMKIISRKKLIKETVRFASDNPTFARELQVLGERRVVAQSGGLSIDNKASNYGAQGVFHGSVYFGQNAESR